MTNWTLYLAPEFVPEFAALPDAVRIALTARARILRSFGPGIGRPYVDTLKGSKFSNMKELRFDASNGKWRAAFAFDPRRAAWVLCAAEKSGKNQKRFYKNLIKCADARFAIILERVQ